MRVWADNQYLTIHLHYAPKLIHKIDEPEPMRVDMFNQMRTDCDQNAIIRQWPRVDLNVMNDVNAIKRADVHSHKTFLLIAATPDIETDAAILGYELVYLVS